MTYPFKKDLLHFIYALHRSTTFSGITEFHVLNNENLPELRTIYRWQKELADKLEYYPCIDFSALGFKHFHLFIKDPAPEMMQLPFALEMLWLVHDVAERILYIHGLLPEEKLSELQRMIPSQAILLFTSDGRQYMHDLALALDHQGRIGSGLNSFGPFQVEASCPKNKLAELARYPLIVPVIFENYGKRLSLEGLWKSIKSRLKETVWQYIPNGNRKLLTNGKAYVKKAFAFMAELGLYRQIRIRYSSLLDEALEVFLVVESSELNSVLQSIQEFCLVAEAYHGLDGKHLLRLIGNHHLIYCLMDLALPSGSSWYFLDKRQKLDCRFKYEALFNIKEMSWQFLFKLDEVRA